MVTLTDDHFSAMAVGTMRYALGRETYAVDQAFEIISTHRQALLPNDRKLMIREIQQALDSDQAGDVRIDRPVWMRLRELLEGEDD